MLLDDDAVEKYIIKISTGSSFEQIEDSIVIFKYPTNLVKLRADLIFDTEYQKAKVEGLLDTKDLEILIKERNLFTDQEQVQLDKLRSKLEAQQILLGKTTLVKANQNRIKGIIDNLKKEIGALEYKKTSTLMMSAEVKANEERTLYLCWANTYNENDEKFWQSYLEFKYTTNLEFRQRVVSSFLKFYSGIPTKKIRYIARHSLWRIRYVNSQKTNEALFGVPSTEYTTDMLNLAYWSNYYDNIYQMMPEDRPSDLVIEDDDSLDAYMKAYYEERSREDASRKSKVKTSGKLSAFDSEEVIVTASNELWRDIEYNKPREAQRLRDRMDVKKRTRRR